MNFQAARHNMVEGQILPSNVTEPRLVDALRAVPRELFVPKQLQGVAYVDGAISLGGGRQIMEPTVFARLVQLAAILPTDVVLDIGAASGYSAAVLARVAATVVAIESDAELFARAGSLLTGLAVDNVALVQGPLAAGCAAHGPYNVIVLEGAVGDIPDGLTAQLADRGRLVAVTQGEPGRAIVIQRFGEVLSRRVAFDATIAPLPGFPARSSFVL
jgi:protein-L-isoaspartate(D-aspartate) O-methyltransferase